MNKKLMIVLGGTFLTLSDARAQGLMDIGAIHGDELRLPFSFVVTSSAGWDSNPRAGSSTGGPGVPQNGQGSGFWQNDFMLHYPLGHGRSRFNVDANYSNIWNFDPPQGTREFENNGGLHADYFRQINERLSLGDEIYYSHQTEPDFAVGASINRPTGGHTSASNKLWVDYKWTNRFSILSSYTIDYIAYDDKTEQEEDNTRSGLLEELRYALTQRTQASLDYRFSFSTFPHNSAADSQSHFLLLGVERPLGRFISMDVKGGVESRSYDGPLGDLSEPYSEAAISYHARENTTFRCYYRSGLEDTGSAGTQSSFSRRTGLAMTHRIIPGLSLSVSLDNINSEHSAGTAGPGNEDTFHASAGLNYSRHLWRSFNLNAGYEFSMVSSDDPLSEYERHRLSLGVSARF